MCGIYVSESSEEGFFSSNFLGPAYLQFLDLKGSTVLLGIPREGVPLDLPINDILGHETRALSILYIWVCS